MVILRFRMLPGPKTMDTLVKHMHNSRTIGQVRDFKIMGIIYQTQPLQRYNQPLQPPQTPQDPYSPSPCDSTDSG